MTIPLRAAKIKVKAMICHPFTSPFISITAGFTSVFLTRKVGPLVSNTLKKQGSWLSSVLMAGKYISFVARLSKISLCITLYVGMGLPNVMFSRVTFAKSSRRDLKTPAKKQPSVYFAKYALNKYVKRTVNGVKQYNIHIIYN